MPAWDVEAQVKAWVEDEAAKQSFTGEVGWLVTWDRVGLLGPDGAVSYRIQWTVGLNIKTGLLDPKQKYLSNTLTCDVSVPDEAEIRKGVAAVIEGLRPHRTKMKAGSNGHGKLPDASPRRTGSPTQAPRSCCHPSLSQSSFSFGFCRRSTETSCSKDQQLCVFGGGRACQQDHPVGQADKDQVEHPCSLEPAILPAAHHHHRQTS